MGSRVRSRAKRSDAPRYFFEEIAQRSGGCVERTSAAEARHAKTGVTARLQPCPLRNRPDLCCDRSWPGWVLAGVAFVHALGQAVQLRGGGAQGLGAVAADVRVRPRR